MEPPPGDELNDVENHLPFGERIEIGGHGADVMGIGGEPDQVIAQPEQLAEQHPDDLGAFGNLDVRKRFHGHHVGEIVGGPGQVVHPRAVGDELVPGLAFSDLLHAAMMVADLQFEIGNLLPVERHDVAQQAVRADMTGTDVEHEPVPSAVFCEYSPVRRLMGPGIGQGIRSHLRGPPGIILSQGMPFPVVGHHDPAQIRMPLEANPEKIVHFPFVPVRGRPDVRNARQGRLPAVETRLEAHSPRGLEGKEVIDHRPVGISAPVASGGLVDGREVIQAKEPR